MARDALLKAIEDDARAQSEAILEEALTAAAAITDGAEAQTSALIEQRRASFKTELDRKRASALSGARVKARSLQLAQRWDAIDRVFDLALSRFKELPRPEYGELLGRFHDELMLAWDATLAGEPIVLINPQDIQLLGRVGAAVRPDDTVSLGVVFVSADGRIRFENTVSSRMNRLRKPAVIRVYKTLFG